MADRWQDFWRGDIGDWILTRGVRIALFLIGGLLAARLINWVAQKITRRIDADFQEGDALVRSESAKHHQAVASAAAAPWWLAATPKHASTKWKPEEGHLFAGRQQPGRRARPQR